MNDVELLLVYGFQAAGAYYRKNGRIRVIRDVAQEVKNNVYAIVNKNEIKYIGYSTAGPGRSLEHHTNEVMKMVFHGLQETVTPENSIQVYIEPYDVSENEAPRTVLNTRKRELIEEFHPEWNIMHNQ